MKKKKRLKKIYPPFGKRLHTGSELLARRMWQYAIVSDLYYLGYARRVNWYIYARGAGINFTFQFGVPSRIGRADLEMEVLAYDFCNVFIVLLLEQFKQDVPSMGWSFRYPYGRQMHVPIFGKKYYVFNRYLTAYKKFSHYVHRNVTLLEFQVLMLKVMFNRKMPSFGRYSHKPLYVHNMRADYIADSGMVRYFELILFLSRVFHRIRYFEYGWYTALYRYSRSGRDREYLGNAFDPLDMYEMLYVHYTRVRSVPTALQHRRRLFLDLATYIDALDFIQKIYNADSYSEIRDKLAWRYNPFSTSWITNEKFLFRGTSVDIAYIRMLGIYTYPPHPLIEPNFDPVTDTRDGRGGYFTTYTRKDGRGKRPKVLYPRRRFRYPVFPAITSFKNWWDDGFEDFIDEDDDGLGDYRD